MKPTIFSDRFGTEELFKPESESGMESIYYDDKAIEEMLDRSQQGIEEKENWANDYLQSFKVASYATKSEMEVRTAIMFTYSTTSNLCSIYDIDQHTINLQVQH